MPTPNLDCLSVDDLHAYAADESHPGRLQQYARTKIRAIRLRIAGSIGAALVAEDECDRIYANLPDGWRW